MKELYNGKNVVVCEYCQYYQSKENSDKYDIFEMNRGFCKKQNSRKRCEADNCEMFTPISGFHTVNWYPGKKE